MQSVHDYAARYGRRLAVFTTCHIVCRPTRQEAEDFYRYYADELADRESIRYIVRQKEATAGSDIAKSERPDTNPDANTRKRGKVYPGTFPGCYTIVGTPDDVAEEMIEMSQAGSGRRVDLLPRLSASDAVFPPGGAAAARARRVAGKQQDDSQPHGVTGWRIVHGATPSRFSFASADRPS